MRIAAFALHNMDPVATIRIADEMEAFAREHNNSFGVSQAYNLRGIAATTQSRYADALRSLMVAREGFEADGNLRGLSDALNTMGAVYCLTGNFSEGLSLFYESLPIAEKLGDSFQRIRTTNNIANVYKDQGDFPAALAACERALSLSREANDIGGIGIALTNIAETQIEMGDFDTALYYLRAAMQVTRKSGDSGFFSFALFHIGLIHVRYERWTLALRYLKASLAIQKQLDNLQFIGRDYIELATPYRQLHRYEEALCTARKGLGIGVELDLPMRIRDAHRALSATYEVMGEMAQALEHLKLSIDAGEEYNRRERHRQVAELRVRQETERARSEAEAERARSALLQKLAHTDELTGLPNRRHMHEQILTTLQRARMSGGLVTLCLADIDHFKRVNDTYGHDAGDAALQHMARCLRTHIGDTGLVARWGGEEFCLLFEGLTERDVETLARALLIRLAESPMSWHEHSLTLSLTLGVSRFTPHDTADDLLRRVDAALYAGKNAGRGQVVVAPAARA
jgi:diguanylate cyclase (GGDEF)-like protein